MREIELLLDSQNQCGESPIWDPVTSRFPGWTLRSRCFSPCRRPAGGR